MKNHPTRADRLKTKLYKEFAGAALYGALAIGGVSTLIYNYAAESVVPSNAAQSFVQGVPLKNSVEMKAQVEEEVALKNQRELKFLLTGLFAGIGILGAAVKIKKIEDTKERLDRELN